MGMVQKVLREMTVVGQCCLYLFGNSFVYSGTLGIVEQAWETYHLHLPCPLPCPLLPPRLQASWLDNGLQGMFSFHSHLSSNLNLLAHLFLICPQHTNHFSKNMN